ncbi:hypothetical protein ACE38W_13260 [Chitinophaga sp. Hz27]|uniref:hypothetical protein n=1 Tax=Chitinophaga sp. Hz27 TaxID=3347169 RepID=UPI0035DAC3B7
MKICAGIMLIIFLAACNHSGLKMPSAAMEIQHDTITDPLEQIPFELKYDPVIKVTPDIFEKGSKGTGSVLLYIDTAGMIISYRVNQAAISKNGVETYSYNYDTDADSNKTKKLLPLLDKFVKSIKTEKISEPPSNEAMVFMAVCNFE